MSIKQASTVDVLLPVRLPAPWLTDTLEGLKMQTFQSWNLIVIIHGHAGDVPETVTQKFPEATVVVLPSTSSFVDVLNSGLEVSSATYLARLDADDIPERTRLETQSRFLDENPDTALVCSRVTRIGTNGQVLGTYPSAVPRGDLLRGLRWKNIIPHPTVMIRRVAFKNLRSYNSAAVYVEDYEFWLRLASSSKIYMLPEPLVRYRVHEHQVTRTKAISKAGRAAVYRAKRDLAWERGELTIMVMIRHALWSTAQILRAISRKEL